VGHKLSISLIPINAVNDYDTIISNKCVGLFVMRAKVQSIMSIEKSQQLLREKGYSDAEIKQMTSESTVLANILIDEYLKDKK